MDATTESRDSVPIAGDALDVVLARIQGVSPVLVTPFTAQGELDKRGHAQVVDYVLGTGVSSLLMFGLVGESYKLDDDERRALLRRLVEQSKGADLTIIASVTDHATEVAVRRAQEWLALGAHAINILPPSFLNPTAESVQEHVETIVEAIDAPVVCQLAPNETGTTLTSSFLVGLTMSHRNFRVVKVENQPPGATIAVLLGETDGRLRSLVGYAGLGWPDAVRAGAIGVQPSCSFTELYVLAQSALDSGDERGFERMHSELLPFLTDWMTDVERLIAVDKAILCRRGLIESPVCRRPRHALDKRDLERIDDFLTVFKERLP